MRDGPRTVWIELTGGHLDGQPTTVNCLPVWVCGPAGRSEQLVTTGTVRWVADVPYEVHVPRSRLHEWHSEHDTTDPRDVDIERFWESLRWF